VVLVGRGAQLILHDVPGVFNVRTAAPLSVRLQRVAERFGVNETQAEEIIRKHDRERRALMQSVFEQDVQDWALYDMILNTAHYSASSAAEVVGTGLDCKDQAVDVTHWKERLSSMALAKRVEAVIKKRLTPATAWKIEVESDAEGVLVLSGKVTDGTHKKRAEKIAQEYSGVTGLRNEIKVTQYPFGY
jgi:hypothetical protein